MLSQLYIQNIAVIKEAMIAFEPGFNVFTGETGAGKTILISAIHTVLGERTSRDIIRTGEKNAAVSAVFTGLSEEMRGQLADLGYPVEEGEELLISREIGQDGRSSCRIGGRPATASILKSLAGGLIDIHGQRDNQQLFALEQQLRLIDDFGGLSAQREKYTAAYREMTAIRRQMEESQMDESEKARRVDLLQYQIDEIAAADLQLGEEEELLAQRRLIRNRERITASLSGALALLEGGGEEELPSLSDQMDALTGELHSAAQYVESLTATASQIESMGYELSELAVTLSDLLEGMEYDPQQAEQVEERLDLLASLKRKYGADVASILEFLSAAQTELEEITFSQERLEQLQAAYTKAEELSITLADALSAARRKAADRFLKQVSGELAFLDMPSVRLEAAFTPKPLGASGGDEMELMIATNPGEAPRPLAKTASGGELARIMLSIKNALADKDKVDTMIFDEVDTGVSGRAAQKIGRKLHQVACNRQVICVTHLAQVASFADHHLFISKAVEGDRTFTTVRPLEGEERVQELARIISGDAITPATLQNARDMLQSAQ